MHPKFLKGVISYNYCRICGYTPHTQNDKPNRAPLRFWDPDDGWKIGTLCRGCADEFLDVKPSPEDYAYREHNSDICTDEAETDEDLLLTVL